jgi:hypothetical protein
LVAQSALQLAAALRRKRSCGPATSAIEVNRWIVADPLVSFRPAGGPKRSRGWHGREGARSPPTWANYSDEIAELRLGEKREGLPRGTCRLHKEIDCYSYGSP